MSEGLRAENAELRRRIDSVMHAGDMEHARMAALIGAATTMLNQLAVLRYPDESSLWRLGGGALETAYQDLKRAAAAVRPQADALLALLADMSRQVGEQNATIGYQDAMLAEQRTALDAAYHALMSYANKNSAPDLAIEVAAHIQATIEKVSKE
jgi:hypothetical protein